MRKKYRKLKKQVSHLIVVEAQRNVLPCWQDDDRRRWREGQKIRGDYMFEQIQKWWRARRTSSIYIMELVLALGPGHYIPPSVHNRMCQHDASS